MRKDHNRVSILFEPAKKMNILHKRDVRDSLQDVKKELDTKNII